VEPALPAAPPGGMVWYFSETSAQLAHSMPTAATKAAGLARVERGFI
jgi:hypothetical protein